jgi:formate hydrogenlyase subunit 3/multisubunit Na+/H+ antiporter MnhD subunit
VKCGLVPVNFWLPRCYTASPAIFIPVLAGITLNLGSYGIIRFTVDLVAGRNVGQGLVALVTGSLTA